MVHRNRDSLSIPQEFLDTKWNDIRSQALVEGNNHKTKKACYRDTTKDTLIPFYEEKCAYCERGRGFELQIDHYRPTKKRNIINDNKYNQPGYYWLAYEWTNLIPLCSYCNRPKSTKFPLENWSENNRVISHVPTQSLNNVQVVLLESLNRIEKPLLIHPELEPVPSRHFYYLNDGRMIGRTSMGKETIEVLQLNRKDLIRERMKIISTFVDDINRSFADFVDSRDSSRFKGGLILIFGKIVNGCNSNHVFSMLHIYIYRYFEYYICRHLSSSDVSKKSLDYFGEFKQYQNLL